MSKKYIRKMTKAELFKEEEKLNLMISKGICDAETMKYKKKIRHALYECRYCADAKYRYITDNKTGETKELFTGDCELNACPYKDYFSSQTMNKTDKLLKKMLKSVE